MHAINHVRQTDGLSDYCPAFVDDLCVHSETYLDHVHRLRTVLEALFRRRHKIAATKMYVGYLNIKLLGHYVGAGGV